MAQGETPPEVDDQDPNDRLVQHGPVRTILLEQRLQPVELSR